MPQRASRDAHYSRSFGSATYYFARAMGDFRATAALRQHIGRGADYAARFIPDMAERLAEQPKFSRPRDIADVSQCQCLEKMTISARRRLRCFLRAGHGHTWRRGYFEGAHSSI